MYDFEDFDAKFTSKREEPKEKMIDSITHILYESNFCLCGNSMFMVEPLKDNLPKEIR